MGVERRAEIVALLVTDLRDSQDVLRNFERDIDAGLANWQEEFAGGDLPPHDAQAGIDGAIAIDFVR